MRLVFVLVLLNFNSICAIFKASQNADSENNSYKAESDMMQFPYAVKIFSRENQRTLSGYSCSGSIIHQLWIATAAHCVYGFKIFDVFIGNVTNDVNHVVRATNIFIHPNFIIEPELLNDFALMKLKRSLNTLNNSKWRFEIFDGVKTFVAFQQLLRFCHCLWALKLTRVWWDCKESLLVMESWEIVRKF